MKSLGILCAIAWVATAPSAVYAANASSSVCGGSDCDRYICILNFLQHNTLTVYIVYITSSGVVFVSKQVQFKLFKLTSRLARAGVHQQITSKLPNKSKNLM